MKRKTSFLGLIFWMTLILHAGEKPNVLFIAVDDLNDYISPLGGYPGVKTPNFDRLASMGVMFTNAHTPSPKCGPARCAIMTGLQPFVTGVYSNEEDDQAAVKRTGSLNKEFLENGYHVAGAGKIYHKFAFIESDWSEVMAKQRWPKPRPGDVVDYAGGFSKTGSYPDSKEDRTADYRAVSWTIDQLSAPRSSPFFIACGIYRPHVPWIVPEKYYRDIQLSSIERPDYAGQKEDLEDVPLFGRRLAFQRFKKSTDDYRKSPHADIRSADHGRELIQAYLACIAYVDAQLGRLLDAYEASPERDNTLLVLWSDHGWHLGEKAHWRKSTLWEEATRTPLFMVIPGVTEPGSRIDRPVSLLDLYPTLREYCNLQSDREISGDSLFPLIESPTTAEWRDHALTSYKEKSITVRTPTHRLIRYPDGEEEFYDHRRDPEEQINLINNSQGSKELEDTRHLLPALTEMADPLSTTSHSSN
jgi:arylsulfatase A-like enzyme